MTEYTLVTKKMVPVWSSAIKIDVSVELRAAFGKPAVVKLDIRCSQMLRSKCISPAKPSADAIRQHIKIIHAQLDALETAL